MRADAESYRIRASLSPARIQAGKGVAVTLTWYELSLAALVGCRRQVHSMRDGRADRPSVHRDNGWTLHIEGAAGELAAAKAMDRYWAGSVNAFHGAADVGDIEVRTRWRPDYDLIIRSHDTSDAAFVLVVGLAPYFRVVGFMRGAEARQERFWRDPNGDGAAWFVPQEELHPIADLH